MTIRLSPANSACASGKREQGGLGRLDASADDDGNEYGLNLADASARKHLMTQCERYFFGDGEAVAVPGYKPHPEEDQK